MPDGSLDFLHKLRPVLKRDDDGRGHRAKADFVFLLEVRNDELMLTVADSGGRPKLVDASRYGGETGAVLRMMAELRASGAFNWFGGGDTPWAISVDAHPEVLAALLRCDNVAGPDLQPLRRTGAAAAIVLDIADTDDAAIVSPRLELCAGAVRSDRFLMLSDSLAACGGVVYEIPGGVGSNYRRIGMLAQPVRRDSIETYLAVFLTYARNVKIEYGNCVTVFKEDAVKAVPTLVIDKIDVDRALYMTLTSTIADEDGESAGRLQPDYDVTVDAGRTITARRIEHADTDSLCEELLDEIKACAPDRQSRAAVYNDGSLFIVPEEVASPFLLGGLPAILGKYRVVGVDKLRRYKLRPVVPKLRVSLTSGVDFLEGSADVDVDGEIMTLQDLLDQYRRHKYITMADGERGVLDEKFVRRIERIFKPLKDDRFGVSFFDLPEVERLLADTDSGSGDALKRPREFYAGFNTLGAQHLVLPDVNADLRPYQIEGVKWLKYLYDNNMGGCLADDMGLGKTLQIISLITLINAGRKGPVMVVMSRSLLFNWQAELARFAPALRVYTYYGAERDLDVAMQSDVVLTTYAIVRNDIENMVHREFDTVVLDESQTIKNVAARQTRSVYLLHAAHRFAVSGTPIENNLGELYSLFRFLNPAMFGSLEDFNHRYALPVQRDDDRDATEALRRKIFPFMLRRLKRDVLSDLPERVEQTIYVDMEADHRRAYEQRRRYFRERIEAAIETDGLQRSQFVMLQALSELRRMATVPETLTDGRVTSPKTDLLFERIQSAIDNGHKVVVFFNFIAGIELLGERLVEAGIRFGKMTGSTSDRSTVVSSFQNDPDCRVMLMTLKTGGVGLNLTAADMVFIAEPWWNRAAEEQAVNRLHRIGQKSTVFSFSLITHDTIEEKIEQLQQRKSQLFTNIIGSDSASLKTLSEDDIDYLLS